MKNIHVLSATLLPLLLAACGGGDTAPAPAAAPRASAAAPAATGPASGHAGVHGAIQFQGEAPKAQVISFKADAVCEKAHSSAMQIEDVVVNGNGTLKNVFVYVKSGLEGKTYPTPAEPAIFDQHGCVYQPHVLGMQVKQKLKILNSDDTLHNVHALPSKNPQFNMAMPKFLKEKEVTFENPEVMIKVKCEVHPWMAAWIGVVEHPFFSTTDDQGSFSLEGLPAGDYTIEAWHEKYGQQTQQVTLAADEVKEISFTFSAQ